MFGSVYWVSLGLCTRSHWVCVLSLSIFIFFLYLDVVAVKVLLCEAFYVYVLLFCYLCFFFFQKKRLLIYYGSLKFFVIFVLCPFKFFIFLPFLHFFKIQQNV